MSPVNRREIMNFIICPQCGKQSSYVLVQHITLAVCSHCEQATVMERGIIIRLDIAKYRFYPDIQRDLIAIALAAQALANNWETVA